MHARPRLLFVSHSSAYGGAETVLTQCLDDLCENYDLYLITHRGPNTELINHPALKDSWVIHRFNGALDLQLNWLAVLLFPFGTLKNMYLTRKMIRQHDIDLVVSNSGTFCFASLAARTCMRPHVTLIQETIDSPFLRNLVFRVNEACSRAMLFVSEYSRNLHPHSHKSIVLQQGLSSIRYTQLEKSAHAPHCPFRVGLVGRIYPVKGTDYFIEIARHCKKDGALAEFWVYGAVGDQRYFTSLQEQIRAASLEHTVYFKGFAEIADILREIDLLAITSRSESFPLIALEAMAAAVPIVSFAVGDMPKLIQNEITGYVFPGPASLSALARCVADLAKDPARAAALGTAGQGRVHKHYLVPISTQLERVIVPYLSV